MDEIGTARAILESVHQELSRRPGYRLARLGLRLGEQVGINGDALQSCFEKLVQGTTLESVPLEIECCRVADGRRGDELDLAYMEFEEFSEGVGV